jgi:hypothetical protein
MADDPMAVTNSEGSDEIAAADPFADAPVVKMEPLEVDEDTGVAKPQKVVPALPPNAEEGEVTRTAGPSAQATLEANVGVGPTSTNGGIADAALGQHTKGENEPIDAMVNVVGGISRGALG